MENELGLSIVIPVYNEEKNIPLTYESAKKVLDSTGKTYELIMIDDGSKDASWVELSKIAKNDHNVKLIKHGRNMGMSQVYQNGFDHSSGKYVLTLSCDLENDASDIIYVIEKLDEGYDVVNTNRVGRWQKGKSASVLRTIPSACANWLIVKVTGIKLKDNGSGLKGFRKFVVKNLRLYGEMHRFFAAYSSIYTDKITEIDVSYKDRIYGKSAYGSITRTFKVFLDLFSLKFLVSMSRKPYALMPGRLFGSFGIFFTLIGLTTTLWLVSQKLFLGQTIGDRPLLIFSFIFIVLGVQLVLTGFVGELVMRMYFESGGRKVYTVKEEVNFK